MNSFSDGGGGNTLNSSPVQASWQAPLTNEILSLVGEIAQRLDNALSNDQVGLVGAAGTGTYDGNMVASNIPTSNVPVVIVGMPGSAEISTMSGMSGLGGAMSGEYAAVQDFLKLIQTETSENASMALDGYKNDNESDDYYYATETNIGPGNLELGINNTMFGSANWANGLSNRESGSFDAVIGYENALLGNNNSAIGLLNEQHGSSNFTNGLLNTSSGQSNVISGSQNNVIGSGNEVAGSGNTTSGTSNLISGSANQVAGTNNSAQGDLNIIGNGTANKVTGNDNRVSGSNNYINGSYSGESGSGDSILGSNDSITGMNSIIEGDGDVINGDNALIIGNGLHATTGQTVWQASGVTYIVNADGSFSQMNADGQTITGVSATAAGIQIPKA